MRKYHILLLGGDPVMRSALQVSLLMYGFNVTAARDLDDACLCLARSVRSEHFSIELVLTDIHCPEHSADNVHRMLTDRGMSIPTVFIDDSDPDSADHPEHTHWLKRPVRQNELRDLVSRLCGC